MDNKGPTRNVTVKSVIYSKHFNLGYDDYVKRRPYNKQYDNWSANDQINYERGRHYAVIFGNDKSFVPKIGNKVTEAAIYAAQIMVNNRFMI